MGCHSNFNNVAGDFFDDNRRRRRECEAALDLVRGVEDLRDEFYED